MAVTKKSLIDNSPSTKTTPTKAPKADVASPLAPSKMKTAQSGGGVGGRR